MPINKIVINKFNFILISAILLVACGSAPNQEFELNIKSRKVINQESQIRVKTGDHVILNFTTDEEGSAHIDQYPNAKTNISPGGNWKIEFDATKSGRFDLKFVPGGRISFANTGDGATGINASGSLFRSPTMITDQTFTYEVGDDLDLKTIKYYNHMKRSNTGKLIIDSNSDLSGTFEIEIVGKGAFDPDEATIKPGTKVTWTNYTKDRQMVSSGEVPEVVETEANIKLLTILIE
ncbi:MAG: hypothetical protein FI718_05545 [SAR202 cluster bacterium]|nr:hypothetical protein [Chloroflexota bacterium]MQG39432.1 hypothetical protein [SAR202 cluster bacterium]|tara:strand:+ start:6594 stop:7301 length:708 start_codon:yes stop_codon:yes gene_type:complete